MRAVISNKPRTEKKRNRLAQIKMFPTIVADTGDFETIRKFVTSIARLEKSVASNIA